MGEVGHEGGNFESFGLILALVTLQATPSSTSSSTASFSAFQLASQATPTDLQLGIHPILHYPKTIGKSILKSSWISRVPGSETKVPRPIPPPPPGMPLHHLHPFKWKTLATIEVSGGDVIVCHLNEERFWRRTHWFLAINGYELLHVNPYENNKKSAEIRADRRLYVPDRFPNYIDSMSCKNIGNGGYDVGMIVQRAMEWNVRVVFYDEDTCSSYHWVVYWVTGRLPEPKPYIPSPSKRLHPKCRLNNIKKWPQPLDSDPMWANPIDAFVGLTEPKPVDYSNGDLDLEDSVILILPEQR